MPDSQLGNNPWVLRMTSDTEVTKRSEYQRRSDEVNQSACRRSQQTIFQNPYRSFGFNRAMLKHTNHIKDESKLAHLAGHFDKLHSCFTEHVLALEGLGAE